MVALNKILSLQVSELPESDQLLLNQIAGKTKQLNIKLEKLLSDLTQSNQEPKENDDDNKDKR
tara:strand:- start:260 stop:448 length:189 start_codon:yes stop_codon:yes gene_type:complete